MKEVELKLPAQNGVPMRLEFILRQALGEWIRQLIIRVDPFDNNVLSFGMGFPPMESNSIPFGSRSHLTIVGYGKCAIIVFKDGRLD